MSRKPAGLAPRAEDAVPIEAIRLSEAFARVHDAAKQNAKILESIPEWAQDNILSMIDTLKHEEDCFEPNDDSIEVLVKAAALFRIALNEELETYVRDPNYNQPLRLNHEDWFFCDERVPIEFNDWLSMNATPGPINETIIRGKRRPVFLLKDQFEKWFAETFKVGLKSHKKRPGSYEIADAPIVEEMHELIESGKAKSARDAAEQLFNLAKGFGTPESVMTRLRRAYYERYRNIALIAPNNSDANVR
jgi:hypothetical protein